MIASMTPSRIEFDLDGVSYTVHGEALDPAFGLDYVIYSKDFHFTEAAKESLPIPENIKRKILGEISAELRSRGTRLEMDPHG